MEEPLTLVPEEPEARRAQVRAAAAGLVEASVAEARAVGAQLRCIHRLWLAGQASRTAARFEAMARAEADYAQVGRVRPDPLGPLAEPVDQLVVDVAAEVGPALRLPAGTARRRVEDAVILAEDLPDVLAALEAGRIGWAQASVMVEQWRELIFQAPTGAGYDEVPPPVAAVGRLVAELLERAPGLTAARLRAVARARRGVLVAGAQERARRAGRKNRAVWVEPGEDGLACLHALLEAPVAMAVKDRVDQLVARLGEEVPPHPGLVYLPRLQDPEETEDRSVGELRADVLADLLLDGVLPQVPGFPPGVRGRVSVVVPAALLAAENPTGNPSGPGVPGPGVPQCGAPVLSGYGPISVEVARQLAAGAGAWHRILTHPVTGVVLDHDRTVYAVPAGLRRLVELRDGTCRFPGCRRRAEACDLDHTVAWAQGGATAEHNLAVLCRHHHRIKHRDGALGRWSLRRIPPGLPGHRTPTDPAPGTTEPGSTTSRNAGSTGPGSGSSGDSAGDWAGQCAVLEWTSPAGLVHRTEPEQPISPGLGARCPDPPATGHPADDPAPLDPAEDPPPF